VGTGVFAGAAKHLGLPDLEQLTVESMTVEAVTTSEIEGEILDRASVQSSIRRQLGLAANKRRVKPAEQGIAEMMVDLCRSFAEPLIRRDVVLVAPDAVERSCGPRRCRPLPNR